ncbi:PDZ domain-containing protein [Chitinibacter sp. SCUT-21]|uniref:M61 family metallopeptidase n=1 Tax=Chitinibacter sp. SCUT-21 TaxID=2970891 RepID=UPI0035A74468
MSIYYQISILDAATHRFAVKLTINNPDRNGQQLQLPVWIPGSYLIREFARHIVQLTATSVGKKLQVTKVNKSTWQVSPSEHPIVVEYEVYAFDLSVRGAYLDQTRAFFNGTSVFLAVQGQLDSPCEVSICAADFYSELDWKVATGMTAITVDSSGFGLYRAGNYDELIDCPVEVSDFSLLEFEACGVPHKMVISGRHTADLERLVKDLKPICEYQIRLFGEPAPFKHYLFMTVAVGDGYGGLEHRNSTALICSRNDLPQRGDPALSAGYRQFLGLCSHEYFHSWNVKRIKPAAFAPYDLQQENYSTLLWAFEGVTSYYDDLCLLRAGIINIDEYLELLAQTATAVQRGYGRIRQTLNDSSIDTWVKYYRQDENSPNELVSYYTKGALVALCLDLYIRTETQNQKGLDDVMQALWLRFGKDFDQYGKGVGEQEWELIASEVSGLDLRAFFDLAIRSTQDLPVAQLLQKIGVETQLRPSAGANDKGGWMDTLPKPCSSFGMRYQSEPAGLKITHVLAGQAAAQAGLAAGDLILAIDGLRATSASLEKITAQTSFNEPLQIHVFRRDELMSFNLSPLPSPCDTYGFRLQKDCKELKFVLLA